MLSFLSSTLRLIYGMFAILLLAFGLLLNLMHIPIQVITIIFHLDFVFTYIKPVYQFMMYSWCSFILEYIGGIKFHISVSPATYHYLQEYKSSHNTAGSILLQMNHRARVDWMMTWAALQRLDLIQYLVIVSRMLLKYIPVIGWAFNWCGILLHRDWEIDKDILLPMVKVLGSPLIQPRFILLFFSEGTDLWQKAIAASNRYADKYNLQRYKYVLHPRTKGFVEMVHQLKENLFAIMDATIAYTDYTEGERCNELMLLCGRYPKEVFIHFEIFTVDDIMDQFQEHYANADDDDDEKGQYALGSYQQRDDYIPSGYVVVEERQRFVQCFLEDADENGMEIMDHAIEDWIKNSFVKKEKRLRDFYENGRWNEEHKIKYAHIPRSAYIITCIYHFVHLLGWIYLWNRCVWLIGLMCVVNMILTYFDVVGQIIRSYAPVVDAMDVKEKLKRS